MTLKKNNYINLFHIFVISLILFYIGIMKKKTNKNIYIILGLLTLFIPFAVPIPNFNKLTYWNSIKIFHYLLIFILIIFSYYGYFNNLSNNTYNILIFISLFIFFYHLYRLYHNKY